MVTVIGCEEVAIQYTCACLVLSFVLNVMLLSLQLNGMSIKLVSIMKVLPSPRQDCALEVYVVPPTTSSAVCVTVELVTCFLYQLALMLRSLVIGRVLPLLAKLDSEIELSPAVQLDIPV